MQTRRIVQFLTVAAKRRKERPGIENLARALHSWRAILGSEHVITDPVALAASQTATFATAQRIPAIIRPATREEVRSCVRIANLHRTAIYPVSTGKNWGFGSRVPARDGCVLMELNRLNRILDYDEQLAYVTVEPGVTFRQVHEFLRAQDSGLMLSITGSTPDSSIVGNTLERGFGWGPYTDRFAHVCDLEVVLPTGDLVHTGFGRFPNTKTTPVARWGLGPALDGLFTQSNFGIVTRLTQWLAPRPRYFQVCFFTISHGARLPDLIDAVQSLRFNWSSRIMVTLANDYRFLSVHGQYPWQALANTRPFPPEVLEHIRMLWGADRWWNGAWNGLLGFYETSNEQGIAGRKVVIEALKGVVDRLGFADAMGTEISRWDRPGDLGLAENSCTELVLAEGGLLGVPGERGVAGTYWRKKGPIPRVMDPDRDLCGVVICAPAVPFAGRHVGRAASIMAEAMTRYGFEPVLAATAISERLVHVVGMILYDREVPGEDERAASCHHAMLQSLADEGYLPYRLGIQAMNQLPKAVDDTDELLKTLKRVLDPNNILAPGRYGLG